MYNHLDVHRYGSFDIYEWCRFHLVSPKFVSYFIFSLAIQIAFKQKISNVNRLKESNRSYNLHKYSTLEYITNIGCCLLKAKLNNLSVTFIKWRETLTYLTFNTLSNKNNPWQMIPHANQPIHKKKRSKRWLGEYSIRDAKNKSE